MNSGSALIARITKPVDFLAQKTYREKIYRALWDRAVLNPIKTLVRPLTAGLLFGIALGVIAAPQGGNVTAGSGTISTPDAHTTVVKQNSNNLVVHWNSFNLAQDETVRFRQPSVQSQALNRIFDQNPSQIHGRINANGRVLLVNPSGIFFSPTARVNVGALIASGLPISEQDFMRGKYNFSPAATGEGGVIINRGLLQAATGGSINLIGGAVSNEGMILAEAGQVNLGAGRRAAIDFDGDGLLRFSVDEEILANAHNLDAAVSNSGEIKAEGGSVLLTAKAAQDVFSQVVNNSGVISAGRIQKQDGEIKLIAGGAGSSVLNTGTLDTSSGHSNGGRIGIEAGGSITLAEDAPDGTGVENSDPAPSGQDEIVLQTPVAGEPTDQGSLLLGSEIEISADSVNLGGEVNVDGASGGTIGVEAGDQIVLNGTLSGLGETGQGGQVELIGMDIDINRQAHIDISGLLGGGTIQVGGSERGGDLRGRRAKELTVEEGARFDADALERGDGGRVIFWSDATRFAGHIQALGGPLGGDGGFAEVSGHHLWMTGHADLRAPQGDWGELLLDPGTVTICGPPDASCMNDPADTFTDTFINTQLGMGDLSIDTAAASTGFLDINLTDTVDLNWATASILTLTAGRDINLAGSITAMSGGTLVLSFVNQLDFAGASVDVGTVTATGGGAASILQGPATGENLWTVTGATDAGTLVFGGQTVDFSSVGNLNGGAGADTFDVDAALTGSITGGAGANIYNLESGGSVSGGIIAGADDETFNINADYTLNLDGLGGADTFNMGAVLTGNIDGGAGDNIYNLNSGGSVSGTITGGADADTFVFDGGSVAGMVDGAGGVNELNYNALGSQVDVTLTGLGSTTGFAGTASQTGGFDDITNLVGGTATSDSLLGLDAVATFTLASGGNTYESTNTLGFSNIEDLQGGNAVDTFTVSAGHSGTLRGGAGNDIFTLTDALTGTIEGEAGDNTYNLDGGGSVSLGITGGDDDDTFVFNGGSVTGLVDGADGVNELNYNALVSQVDVVLTGLGGTTGFSGTASQTGGFDDITNLVGGTATSDSLQGLDAVATFTLASGGNTYESTNTLGFSNIEDLQGGDAVDTFTVSAGHSGTLSGGAGNDIFTLTAALTGGIAGGAGDNVFNLSGGGGVISGIVNLAAGSNNFWYHRLGETLTTATNGVTGTGSLFIPDIDRGDLTIGTGDLILPDLTGFTGHLVIGGIINFLTDPDVPYYVNPTPEPPTAPLPTILVNTETLTVAGIIPPSGTTATRPAIETGGPVTLLARNINLNNDITARGMIGLVAAATVAGEGLITLAGGEVTLTAPASTTPPSGAFIASNFVNPIDLVLAFSGGEVDIAVGSGTNIPVSGLSDNAASTDDPDFEAFIDAIRVGRTEANVPVRICTSAVCSFAPDAVPVIPAISLPPPPLDVVPILAESFALAIVTTPIAGTLDFSGRTMPVDITLTGLGSTGGFAGMSVDGAFDNIINLIGGSDLGDSLIGLDEDATFTLASTGNTYVFGGRTLDFSGIENLFGGNMADTFNVGAAFAGTISGGAGANVYNLNSGGSLNGITAGADGEIFNINAAYTLNLDGLGGADTFNIASGGDLTGTIVGGAGANIYNFNGGSVDGLTAGGAGVTETFNINADTTLSSLDGSVGTDIFNLNAVLTGNIGGGAGDNTYNLDMNGEVTGSITGGANADAFVFDGGSVTGMVDGAGGVNELNYNALGSQVDVVLTGLGGTVGFDGTATGTGGFNDITSVVGGTAMTDTLRGLDAIATFTVNTANGGTYESTNVLGFSNIESLIGGSMADTFMVGDTLAGSITGGNGANIYNLNTGGSVTGGIIAGAGDEMFNINGAFTADLDGLGGADTFNIEAALTGGITGGTGGNIYNLESGGSVTGGITAGADDETFNINAAYTLDLDGLGGADTFNIEAALTGGITGGTGANIYNLNTGGSVTGGITAGADDETFNINAAYTLNLDGLGGADTFTLTAALTGDIEGGAGANIYNLNSGGSVTGDITAGADDETFNINAAYTLNLDGLGGADTFNIASGGDLTGTIVGGAGANIYNFNGGSVDGLTAGGVGVTETFNINADTTLSSLDGGAGADIFNIGAVLTGSISGGFGSNTYNLDSGGSVSGTITGGANLDTFVFDGGSVTGVVGGAGGTNTLNYNALGSQVQVALTGLGSTEGFDGTATGTGGFNDITSVVGGTAMTDTLRGLDADATFNLAGTNSYVSGNTLMFSAIEDLQGGSMIDTFTVTAAHSGTLSGGAGNDIFTLTDALTGDIEGEAGDNTYNLDGGGSVSLGITGGANADTFVFNGGSVTGLVDGAGGVNTLDYNQLATQVDITLTGLGNTVGFDGTATDTGGFDDITNLVGGSAMTDSLTGQNQIATFTVDTANGGTYQSTNMLGFSGIESLTGGTMADTFTVDAALAGSITGGLGANLYNLNTGSVAGDITGGGGDEMFNINGAFTADLNGQGGADTFTVGAALTGMIQGGAGANIYNLESGGSVTGDITGGGGDEMFNINGAFTADLNGQGGADTFTVDAALTGLIEGGAGANTYNLNSGGSVSGTITGGVDADTFVFDGGSVTGMVDGAGGANTLDYNQLATQVDITLTGLGNTVGFDGTATDTGGFDDITNLVGGSATTDTLTGQNQIATFTVNTANGGTYGSQARTLGFSNIESLTGGAMADTFTVGAALAGSITGGLGANIYNLNTGGSVAGGITGGGGDEMFNINGAFTADLDGLGGADTFNIEAALTGGITGGTGANIYNLESGGSVTEGITAGADDETFNINAAYTLDLDGLGGADTFNIEAALTGGITGGGGANVYNLESGGSVTGGITAGADGEMFNINGAFTADLNGQGGADTFNLNEALTGGIEGGAGANTYNLNSGGSVSGTITGGADADTFVFAGGSVAGMVDGAGGVNELNYNALSSQVAVALTGLGSTTGFTGTASQTGGFDDITNLVGGTATSDSLQGLDAVATFTLASGGNTYMSTNMLGFSNIEDLQGGNAVDTFTVSAGHSGTLSGGAGNDIFTLTAALTGGIEGEAGDNTYNLNTGGSVSGTITGGADADTFVFDGGSVAGMVDGAGGVNTLDYSALGSQVVVVLTGLGGTTGIGFAGTASQTGGFDDITNLVGGTATSDSLQGLDAVATFTLASGGNTYMSTNMLSFSNIEDLQGGNAVDTFTVSAGHSGALSGGAGNDIFTLTAALTGGIAGEAGDNTYNLNTGGSVSGTITGGANADTFVFDGGSVAGMVDGAEGVNELNYNALSSPVAVVLTGLGGTTGIGFAGTANDIGTGFDDITNLVGGTTSDSLQGLDAVATFTLASGGNTYMSTNTLGFSNIEDLQGGTMADTFDVGAAHSGNLQGGGGADVFTLTDALTGSIEGGAGANIYNLESGGSVSAGITAGADDETFNINAAYTLNLDGLGGADTFNMGAVLTGNIGGGAGDNTYNLNMNGEVTGTITGGADADDFVFDGGSVTGTVDGAGGVNTLDYNALASQVDVTLIGLGGTVGFDGTATDTGGFNDITNLVGGTAITDTLLGLDAIATFTLASTGNTYESTNTLDFSNIEDLQGGSMADTFDVSAAHSGNLQGGGGADVFTLTDALTGSIEGGAGANIYNLESGGSVSAGITAGADDEEFNINAAYTLDLDGLGGADTFNVNEALTGDIVGGAGEDSFILGASGSANNLDGGADSDTFQGRNVVSTFNVAGGSGTYGATGGFMQTFSNIEDLQGGSMADTFDVSAAHSGNLQGGDGADVFMLTAALTGSIEGGAGANIYNLESGGSVSGGITAGADDEEFNINAAYTLDLDGLGGADTFNVNEALTGDIVGGAGEDSFILGASGSANNLDGGADSDTFQGRNVVSTFNVAGGNGTYGATGGFMQTFSNIEDLQGGTMADTFDVSAAHSGNLQGGDGADVFMLTAALTGSIEGGLGANLYTLDGGSVTGGITGGGGDEMFNIDGDFTANLNGQGGVDTFTVDAALTGMIEGGAGEDTFILGASGSASGGLDGGADTDTFRGRDAVATFGIDGTNTYEISGSLTQAFSNIENLQGGSMADTFTVTAVHSGNLQGGGGADIFTLMAALTGTIEGGVGANIYNLESGGSVSAGISAGADGETFNINAAYTLNLDGLGGADTFNVGSSGDLTGTIVGGAGANMYNFNGGSVDGLTAGGAGVTETFNINADTTLSSLDGGVGADIFNLNAVLTGNIGGGAGDNTYNLNMNGQVAGGITGGADADNFVFNGGSVTGMVDGAGGVNTLDYTTRTGPVVVTLTGLDSTVGFDGTATDTGGFDDITNLVGTAMTDRLQGLNADATFTLASTGNTYESTNMLGFSNIENLQGGSMADTFTVSTAHSGTLSGGAGNDIFTLTAGLTGGIVGEAGDNTYNLNMNGGVTESITGGADADDFVFDGGSVAGTVDGAGGVNELNYNALGSQVDVTLTGTGNTVGFAGTASQTGGFDDITNLVGGTATSDSLQGLDAVATFTLASGGNTYMSTNMLSFSNIEDLQGGNAVDTFTVSAGHSGALSGGAGNDIFTLTAALTGGIAGGSGDNVFNLSGGGGSISGMVELATASNNYWYHFAGQSLTTDTGSVTGSGSLFIPDIDRGVLVIGTDLILPDLTGFTGHLVIGGIINFLTDPDVPYYVNPTPEPPTAPLPTILVNTETLTVAGIIPPSGTTATRPAIETGGPVTLLARNINLNNDITARGMIGLVAAATVAGEGLITLAGGEVTLTAPASTTRPSGAFIASDIVNPINLVLAFSGGEVDFAVGSGANIQVSALSDNAASTDDPDFEAFINAISTGRTEANVPVRICTSGTACSFAPGEVPVIPNIPLPDDVVPILAEAFALAIVTQTSLIAELIGLKTVASIDIGLFEEDLTLYGQIGTGIALALAQCEEQEGCAPNVTEEELDILISGLEEKVAQLEGLLDEELDDDERPRIEQLLLDYNMLLRDFRQYRESLREFFAVEDEVEEEEIQSLEEELAPVPVQPGAVKKLTGILENIKSRLEWLEGLKSDPEALERLGERSNIDLTPEVLDAIIESTRSEAQFIEDSIRRFIEGAPGAGRIGNDRSILLIDRRDMRDIQRQYAQQVPISVSKALQN